MPLPGPNSRLLNIPVVQTVDNREIYEIRTPLPYAPHDGMRDVVLDGSDTLWSLAYEFYGNPLLWWAIADFNDIHDATTEVVAGRRVFIPARSYVDEYLSFIIR